MQLLLKNEEYYEVCALPANQFELRDILEKLRLSDDKAEIHAVIRGDNAVPELNNKRLTADIYRLNFLADRLENTVSPDIYAMRGLVKMETEYDVDELILMTYGLDSVPVIPCSDAYELGEFAIENDMLPELEQCADEILELLDRQKVGEMFCKRDKGIFIGGFYCVPSNYEQPDIQIEIARLEPCFFKILVAPAPKNDEPTDHLAQWISLPQSREYFDEFAKDLGENSIEDCVFYDYQSALPSVQFDDMKKIDMLNDLAHRLNELSNQDFVKLKAVMHLQNTDTISSAMLETELLGTYEFDNQICDYDDFARAYLQKNLPENFDISTMSDTSLEDFGRDILGQKQGVVTPYGVISGRAVSLYEPIISQSEMELTQDFDMEFGGMSL